MCLLGKVPPGGHRALRAPRGRPRAAARLRVQDPAPAVDYRSRKRLSGVRAILTREFCWAVRVVCGSECPRRAVGLAAKSKSRRRSTAADSSRCLRKWSLPFGLLLFCLAGRPQHAAIRQEAFPRPLLCKPLLNEGPIDHDVLNTSFLSLDTPQQCSPEARASSLDFHGVIRS